MLIIQNTLNNTRRYGETPGLHEPVIFHSFRRFPMNQGIAGHVATSGETLNVKDVTEDKRFNSNIDQKVV